MVYIGGHKVKKKTIMTLACIILCAGMLSACGKEDAGAETGAVTETPVSPTPEEGTPTLIPAESTPTPTPVVTTPTPEPEQEYQEWWEKYDAIAWYPDEVPTFPHDSFLIQFSGALPEVERMEEMVLYRTELENILLAVDTYMPQAGHWDEEKTEFAPEDYEALTVAEDARFFICGYNKAENDAYQYAQVSQEVFMEYANGDLKYVVCGLRGKELLYVFENTGP